MTRNFSCLILFLPIVVTVIINCSSQQESLSLPSLVTSEKTLFFSNADSFFKTLKLENIPRSFFSAKRRIMALAADSIGLFVIHMPSLQGAAVAFQEWISFSEGNATTRRFHKDIGKKAIEFETPSGRCLVFYKGKALYGIAAKESGRVLEIAKEWSRNVSG